VYFGRLNPNTGRKPDGNVMISQPSNTPFPTWWRQLNWPNTLTLIRIFLVPVLLVFLMSPKGWYPIIAAVIFLVAAFTDWLDGHLARSMNQITRLGQLLDPIADKLLVTAVLIALVERQQVPAWVVAVILCRETAITGLRAMAADQGIIIAADTLGKYKMLCLVIASLLLILNLPALYLPGMAVLSAGLLLSVVSGIDYLRKYLTKIL
jgi:CDP-diacylglycerol---glycerol-3-phosphate 3-phosphatidyltransferase